MYKLDLNLDRIKSHISTWIKSHIETEIQGLMFSLDKSHHTDLNLGLNNSRGID